ncbi:hypothetical protein ACFL1X_13745, partial [Candidatus Hydrogenedentota bacterium]
MKKAVMFITLLVAFAPTVGISTAFAEEESAEIVLEEHSVLKQALLYIPNRVVDLVDVVVVNFGFGLGGHANVHATRAIQVGVFGQSSTRIGINGREIGTYTERISEFSLG